MRILVIEDDNTISEFIAKGLKESGFAVDLADNGIDGLHLALTESYDIGIFDIMLPGVSGLDIIKKIRASCINFPVIILSARRHVEDRVQGLETGADDYLTKPFCPRELVVRANALLRRADKRPAADIIEFDSGRISMNLKKRTLTKSGEKIHLTPNEFDILEKLISVPGKVFSREEIIDSVMGFDFSGTDRTVDSHIRNLRAKIEEDPKNPRFVLTRRGAGFYFED